MTRCEQSRWSASSPSTRPPFFFRNETAMFRRFFYNIPKRNRRDCDDGIHHRDRNTMATEFRGRGNRNDELLIKSEERNEKKNNNNGQKKTREERKRKKMRKKKYSTTARTTTKKKRTRKKYGRWIQKVEEFFFIFRRGFGFLDVAQVEWKSGRRSFPVRAAQLTTA